MLNYCAFQLVLTYDMLEERCTDDIMFLNFVKQIDSMLPFVCSVINQRTP